MSYFDPSIMAALVVDANLVQRRLTCDQLRLMGFGVVTAVSTLDKAWEALTPEGPQIVIIEWTEPRDAALDFVKRVRDPELSPNTEVSLFMLTSKGKLNDVEDARSAGIDGYLRKPVSVSAIRDRVRHAFVRPKISAEQAEADRRGQRARALAAALDSHMRQLGQSDAASVAQLARTALELADAAGEAGDRHLHFGARELARYLNACNDNLRIDANAARTHTAALFQLALLPSALTPEREKLASGLQQMVAKKLRDARAV